MLLGKIPTPKINRLLSVDILVQVQNHLLNPYAFLKKNCEAEAWLTCHSNLGELSARITQFKGYWITPINIDRGSVIYVAHQKNQRCVQQNFYFLRKVVKSKRLEAFLFNELDVSF